MKLNEALKHHRESSHLTQDELADKLYVSRQAISKWERGETTPDIENLVRLSDIYDISVDELLRGTDYLPKPFSVGETNLRRYLTLMIFGAAFISVGLVPLDVRLGALNFIILSLASICFLKQGKLTVYRNTIVIDYYKNPLQSIAALFNPKKYKYTYKYEDFTSFDLKYEVRNNIYGYPDRFTARIVVDDKIMEIVMWAKRTQEYLPCFVEFLSTKGVNVIDKENVIEIMRNGQRLYEAKRGRADEVER